MRLSISNIAWDPSEDEAVVELLGRYGVDAIDVAPGKYFSDVRLAGVNDITDVRRRWADRGIEIVGMQALLFGTVGLNMFASQDVQERMLDHLDAVCRIGRHLNAKRLVFGSPKNRIKGNLSEKEAREVAVRFFRRLAIIASYHGVTVCLEPNPTKYGADFMIDSDETARIVDAVDRLAIRMQLDTGACALNNESPTGVITAYAHLIGHVHASEPDLLPIGDGTASHGATATTLLRLLPQHIVTIEMLATKSEPHLQSIERALRVAVERYTLNK